MTTTRELTRPSTSTDQPAQISLRSSWHSEDTADHNGGDTAWPLREPVLRMRWAIG